MRVLDVDLDFFLDEVAMDRGELDPRLSDEDYSPWNENDVRRFLEERCGLSVSKKIPGKYVIHHREAFVWWNSLIGSGDLMPPFEVVHVDAHADLGGNSVGQSKLYIGEELLHLPLADRANAAEASTKLDSGNFLVAAIACRWINKLVYVVNPKNMLLDCEDWLFDPKGNGLDIALPKLKRPSGRFFPGMSLNVLEYEPTIGFQPIAAEKMNDSGAFDYMLLCNSPAFTPPAADRLIPVILEYMDLDY